MCLLYAFNFLWNVCLISLNLAQIIIFFFHKTVRKSIISYKGEHFLTNQFIFICSITDLIDNSVYVNILLHFCLNKKKIADSTRTISMNQDNWQMFYNFDWIITIEAHLSYFTFRHQFNQKFILFRNIMISSHKKKNTKNLIHHAYKIDIIMPHTRTLSNS